MDQIIGAESSGPVLRDHVATPPSCRKDPLFPNLLSFSGGLLEKKHGKCWRMRSPTRIRDRSRHSRMWRAASGCLQCRGFPSQDHRGIPVPCFKKKSCHPKIQPKSFLRDPETSPSQLNPWNPWCPDRTSLGPEAFSSKKLALFLVPRWISGLIWGKKCRGWMW